MSQPLVSVIVPAYNHEAYIHDCLMSVVDQTYPHLEIIVLNDGSTDKTGEIIEQFVECHNRKMKYIRKDNEGLCKTLNMGIQLSGGKYIAFIASDDMWLPNRIKEQVTLLENNKNIGLVFSDAFFMMNDKKTALKYSEYKPKVKHCFLNTIQNSNIYELMLTENIVLALTVLIKKNCFNKVGLFDESLLYEDYDMWLRVSKEYPMAYIDKPLAYYRIHETNLSNNSQLMLKGAIQALFKQYKTIRGQHLKVLLFFCRFLLSALINRKNKKRLLYKSQR